MNPSNPNGGGFPFAPQYQGAPTPQAPPQGYPPPAMPQAPAAPQGYAPPPVAPMPAASYPGGPLAPPQYPPQGYAPPPQAPAAPIAPQGRFAGMAGTHLYESGNYFDGAGEYETTILGVVLKDTRKSGPAVIVELQIDATSDPSRVPVGTKKGWIQPLAKRDTAFPNLLGFVAAALGFDASIAAHKQRIEAEIAPQSEGLLERAVGPEQPFAGRKVHVSCRLHKTKAGEIRTISDFRPSRAPQGQ